MKLVWLPLYLTSNLCRLSTALYRCGHPCSDHRPNNLFCFPASAPSSGLRRGVLCQGWLSPTSSFQGMRAYTVILLVFFTREFRDTKPSVFWLGLSIWCFRGTWIGLFVSWTLWMNMISQSQGTVGLTLSCLTCQVAEQQALWGESLWDRLWGCGDRAGVRLWGSFVWSCRYE